LSLLRAVNADFRGLWDRSLFTMGAIGGALANSSSRSDLSFANDPAIPEWAQMSIRPSSRGDGAVFIAPGSVWATKMWNEGGFGELAKSLSADGRKVVFVGSPSERELCERIANRAGVESRAGRTSIPELIGMFRDGAALISNDSGAMHAAAVAG